MTLNEFSNAWIADMEEERAEGADIPESESYVTDLWLKGRYEELWAFILSTYPKPMSENLRSYLAAGPLEDLLASAGPSFIDKVEQEARQHEGFRELLRGVWRNEIEEDVWQRIQALCQ